MKRKATLGLLFFLFSCAAGDLVVRQSLQNAAIAVKTANERLEELMPIISEKALHEVEGTCGSVEDCKAAWREEMSKVERAISSLETAKKALLKFEELYDSNQRSTASLISKASEVLRNLKAALELLQSANVQVEELEEAITLMNVIVEDVKRGQK